MMKLWNKLKGLYRMFNNEKISKKQINSQLESMSRKYWQDKWKECELPVDQFNHFWLYYWQGIRPGRFMYSLFSNDLLMANNAADRTNKKLLSHYANFANWYMRIDSIGSYNAVEDWIVNGGLKNIITSEIENSNED